MKIFSQTTFGLTENELYTTERPRPSLKKINTKIETDSRLSKKHFDIKESLRTVGLRRRRAKILELWWHFT